MTQSATEFWHSSDGLTHITPPDSRHPEAAEFGSIVTALTANSLSVLDFGCGCGRLAHLFGQSAYLGVDISEAALSIARMMRPEYQFQLLDPNKPLPLTDAIFAHTVLLHVPDDAIDAVIGSFRSPLVLISEITGRSWRRNNGKPPPVFNREISEYVEIFARYGFSHADTSCTPYRHYPGTDLTLLQFARYA